MALDKVWLRRSVAIYAEKIDTEGVHAFVEVDGLDVVVRSVRE